MNSDETVGSLPLLRADIVPRTLSIDLSLPLVDNTVRSFNVFVIGVLHVLTGVGKVLDDMLCTK